MVERREFLRQAATGFLGAALVGRELEPLKVEAKGQPELEARIAHVEAQTKVALRDGIDANILAFGALTKQRIPFKAYLNMINQAVRGIEEGMDPFEEDFWKKLEEKNKKPEGSLGASVITSVKIERV